MASGQDVDRGKIVFAQQIGLPTKMPAQDHHIGGGKGDAKFLRRRVPVLAGVRVGFQGVLNQLAGVKPVAVLLVGRTLGQNTLPAK